jgi:hypothetical protein
LKPQPKAISPIWRWAWWRLRLYHEVTVVRADEQLFEYAGCHGGTSLLNGVSASAE